MDFLDTSSLSASQKERGYAPASTINPKQSCLTGVSKLREIGTRGGNLLEHLPKMRQMFKAHASNKLKVGVVCKVLTTSLKTTG
jgi:hypothetical protein